MTRKEAIKRLKSIRKKIHEPTDNQLGWLETWIHTEDVEALDFAIESLEVDLAYDLAYEKASEEI